MYGKVTVIWFRPALQIHIQATIRTCVLAGTARPNSSADAGGIEARRAAAALKHLTRQRAKDKDTEEVCGWVGGWVGGCGTSLNRAEHTSVRERRCPAVVHSSLRPIKTLTGQVGRQTNSLTRLSLTLQ
jgi:hypothetical protein